MKSQMSQQVPLTGPVIFFPPLESETRTHVCTACAAFHCGRQPQTLRKWACLENGPLRPVRINGRLAWKVADIQALLNGQVL